MSEYFELLNVKYRSSQFMSFKIYMIKLSSPLEKENRLLFVFLRKKVLLKKADM